MNPDKMQDDLIKERIKQELSALDAEDVDVEGVMLKPSDCYRFDVSPNHVLFNTNCPEELKKKVQQIINKYAADESGSSK